MGTASQHQGWRSASGAPVLHLLFPGDAPSVRRALTTAMTLFRDLPRGSAPSDPRSGVVEIVLAEVLNNVVEHAYGEHCRGLVELEIARNASALLFRIRDEGLPMPGGDAPAGRAHDLEACAEDLPEGGFGWYLIRELTEDLRYRRSGNRNELTFRIAHGATVPDA